MVQHSFYLDVPAIGRMHRHPHYQNPSKLESQELSRILSHPLQCNLTLFKHYKDLQQKRTVHVTDYTTDTRYQITRLPHYLISTAFTTYSISELAKIKSPHEAVDSLVDTSSRPSTRMGTGWSALICRFRLHRLLEFCMVLFHSDPEGWRWNLPVSCRALS